MMDVLRKELYPGESLYFHNNPNVAGMASESGHVILNPNSPEGVNKDAVYQNELARLYMRGQIPGMDQVRPAGDLTPEQMQGLPTSYQTAPVQDQRETIVARQFSGDPSGGVPTGDQKAFVDAMRRALTGNK